MKTTFYLNGKKTNQIDILISNQNPACTHAARDN